MGVILRKRRKIWSERPRPWRARNNTERCVCLRTTFMVQGNSPPVGLLHLSVLPFVVVFSKLTVGQFPRTQNSTNFEQAEATSSASLLKLSPRSGTSRWLACLLDNSSFVIVPTCDTPIFYDTIIYFPSKNIPEIQKTGTMSLLNDFKGIRSRFFKEFPRSNNRIV